MLRIQQNNQVNGAKSYYSTADYYSEGQELTGVWRGAGARRLGLDGEVRQADWDALCDNLHPQTGDRLTGRTRSDRTVGYDFNFHVPKSVSLLYAMTRDERLLDAFRESVDATMQDIESEMQCRVRKGGKNEDRTTGNMAWGEFVHFTSRPVDGVPDPHLHAHCFVFNTTFDEKEQAWKAGQFRDLKRDAPYFEGMFHSRLAGRLSDMGLPVERSRHGWELSGIDDGLIAKFSRRTAEIEEKAREMGIEDPDAKAELGAKTRARKQKELSFSELQDTWRSRMSQQELETIASLERRIGGDAEPADSGTAARAIDYAATHLFERKSVVPERELLTEALWHSVGKASVEKVKRAAEQSDLIIGERNGRRMATTSNVLAEEQRVVDFARLGRGTCEPFVAKHRDFNRDWLDDGQKQAVKQIAQSRDRVMLLRGVAGSGKTTMLQELVETVEGSGTEVAAFAPSADASRGTLREAGFKDADTVARLLMDQKLQNSVRGKLIVIDEAGLLGMKTTSEVFDLAERLDSRVLLCGDRFQHGSVERGAALRLLEEEAGIVPAEIKEIKRQKGAYKEAVKSLAEGRTADGFRRLDELGWIREVEREDRHKQMASDYVDAIRHGKTALAVSPTHAEGDRITAEIRRELRATKQLGDKERSFKVLESSNLTAAERGDAVNYAPGNVLVFHQNAKGFTRGDRMHLNNDSRVPVEYADRFQLYYASTLNLARGDRVRITRNGLTADGKHRLNNGAIYEVKDFDKGGNIVLDNGWQVGSDFGFLTHGYVVTSHASQGKTVDHVLVGQGSESFVASSREQFYVSASRARQQVTVYTDDKEALLEAVNHTDERVSATELVNGAHRQAMLVRQQLAERAMADRDRAGANREEPAYER